MGLAGQISIKEVSLGSGIIQCITAQPCGHCGLGILKVWTSGPIDNTHRFPDGIDTTARLVLLACESSPSPAQLCTFQHALRRIVPWRPYATEAPGAPDGTRRHIRHSAA